MPRADIPCLDPEFDYYSDYEINDMISAAKSGAASTANAILYSLPSGKYYNGTWAENKKHQVKQEKLRKENPPPPPVIVDASHLYLSLLGIKTKEGFGVLSEFATSRHNQKLFKKYTK